jgi:serine/threonine-protein kinase
MEPKELERFIAMMATSSPGDLACAERLGQRLVEEKLLTQWQHRRLIRGYTKGFFLKQYKLLHPIRSGGMGNVFLAEHTMMRRLVAVKIVSEAQVAESAMKRFRREVELTASLDHPNIVHAFDYNRNGRHHYLVMEFVHGLDLERYVETQGPLHPWTAGRLIAQAALGLQYAHERQIIHRDIKPSNLMVGPRQQLKILDLGLARIEVAGLVALTHENFGVLGTVDFIAPEQIMNPHDTDARTDIYSLGCTLYFALTGRSPFPEGTIAQRLMSHICRACRPIAHYRTDVPVELVDICNRMMAKNPADRFQTAEAVARALESFLKDFADTDLAVEVLKNVGRTSQVAQSQGVQLIEDTVILP